MTEMDTIETARQIDRDTYLKGLGLFTLAQDYYQKMRAAERALIQHLNCADGGDENYGGLISDALYHDDRQSFDATLKRAGYSVAVLADHLDRRHRPPPLLGKTDGDQTAMIEILTAIGALVIVIVVIVAMLGAGFFFLIIFAAFMTGANNDKDMVAVVGLFLLCAVVGGGGLLAIHMMSETARQEPQYAECIADGTKESYCRAMFPRGAAQEKGR